MKILIAYASAGTGHKKAAEALYKQARAFNRDAVIVDILDYTSSFFKFFYSFGYTFLITYLPSLWGLIFDFTNNPKLSWFNLNLESLITRLNAQRFLGLLKKESPDVIITTHFMVGEISAIYKKKKNSTKLFCVVTDFDSHIYWLNNAVDKYCVACEETRQQFIKRKVSSDKIVIKGIPVDKKFSLQLNRNVICQKLSIMPDKFTALVVTGAIGIGPIREIVQALKDEVQILVVSGYNTGLKRDLGKIKSGSLKVFGYVDNMDELMGVSDIIITKAGGLSISESLAKNLPMIFFNLIPGQEKNNARIISDYGLGVIAKDVENIKSTVLRFKKSPSGLEQIRENTKKISHPYSAQKILDLIYDATSTK